MKLIPCPACGRDNSPDAEFCPHCGHPYQSQKNSGRTKAKKCFKCSESATTRCLGCGAFSCPRHVEPHTVGKGRVLLCKSCAEEAEERRQKDLIVGVIIFIVILFVGAAMGS